MDKLVIICGPTAVGKTVTSIKLAKKMNTKIISADSMQIYKNMDVGTAKISKSEMQDIEHYMIDIINPQDEYSVSDYYNDSSKIINDIFSCGKIPIVVGGTGLYINSLIYKMNFNNVSNDETIRKKYKKIYEDYGTDYLYNILCQKNDFIAKTIEKNNIKRVIRALEILDTSDDMLSFDNVKYMYDYKIYMYVLKLDRNILYERINNRVDYMIENGLIDEVVKLKNIGLTSDNQSMKAIGYRQILSYLNGEISEQEAIELIKRDSRRYAKRQYTWFKRYDFAKWIDVEDKSIDDIVEFIKRDVEEK